MLALLAGCVNRGTQPTMPDATESIRPLVELVRVQAAHNESTLFLRVAGGTGSVDQVVVAMTGRRPQPETRSFAKLGCFLACHDWSTGMPNWRPQDGNRPMYLVPGVGVPLDVWVWRAAGIVHTRFDEASATQDGSSDAGETDIDVPDARVDAATSAGAPWQVVITRPLTGTLPLQPGSVYDVALALYNVGTDDRDHYVSLPFSLGLDAAATLTAPAVSGQPSFTDEQTFPPVTVEVFLPGITSWEFLVGAVVNRQGQVRSDDHLHGGARAVASETHTCADCHQVQSRDPQPPLESGGALERLVQRRGGVFGPIGVQP
jgi:hypothetical protein